MVFLSIAEKMWNETEAVSEVEDKSKTVGLKRSVTVRNKTTPPTQRQPPPPSKKLTDSTSNTKNEDERTLKKTAIIGRVKPMFRLQLPANPIFYLSDSLSPEEKTHFREVINRLGGSVSNLNYIGHNCTAFIFKTFLRSEKVLCCVASAKFLLRPEYIAKCERENRFVQVNQWFAL